MACIICDKQLGTAANHEYFETIPYGGTLFFSWGHYGSTVFDPMNGLRLEIVVCDDCLRLKVPLERIALQGSERCLRSIWDGRSTAFHFDEERNDDDQA